MMKISLKEMLANGLHFGHQTRRWNPKMKPYLYTQRNGIHIIDLKKTAKNLVSGLEKLYEIAGSGGHIVFVSTKPHTKEIIQREAERCKQSYVTRRWLGGFFTNFKSIKKRINHLNSLESKQTSGELQRYTKLERLKIAREIDRLNQTMSGIKNISELPTAIIVVDPTRDNIAVKEANKLNIPVFAICDSNSDPSEITYPIPANDDSVKSVSYILEKCADIILLSQGRKPKAKNKDAKSKDNKSAKKETAKTTN